MDPGDVVRRQRPCHTQYAESELCAIMLTRIRDAWLESIVLRSICHVVVDIWHQHRIPILLTSFVALVALRTYLNYTQEKGKLVTFPNLYESDTKTREEKVYPTTTGPRKPNKLQKANKPRRIKGTPPNPSRTKPDIDARPAHIQVHIFFSSLTGNTEKTAQEFTETLGTALKKPEAEPGKFLSPQVHDLSEIDYDDYLVSPPWSTNDDEACVKHFYLFLIPSYNIDTINDNVLQHLRETHHDFRIETAPLAGLLGFSVFGFGDREGWSTEEDGFCFQAKELDKWMARMTGGKRAYPLGMGDGKTDGAERLGEWHSGLLEVLLFLARTGSLGEGVPGSGDAVESDDEEGLDDDGKVFFEERAPQPKKPGSIHDMEDLGRVMDGGPNTENTPEARGGAPIVVDFTSYEKSKSRTAAPATTVKEMVPKNSPTYMALTRQGYQVVGSHSGVKICRWTKSALRGRGSCYKFSFYGIHSHQCMETTPSLSCSNKCVFCWRHGTNPVGTTWRWIVDPPELIFNGVKEGHYRKIKQLRGVPGVRAERFAEAMRIRHCALSLVGEPIFYPHINSFLSMLHGERISSFLVCNAQHPDQLVSLHHVTQLYVSVDASNRDALRRIDRPLHRDFWERFCKCMDVLRERRNRQRTVFRLTLVKGFNLDDEVEGYAILVERARPCFVEIKGVTYCGTATAGSAGLTMANVPFWHEVQVFVEALDARLREKGLAYGIAAEHAHSCCALLACETFRKDGKWHTLIDYQRFFDLLEDKGPAGDFGPEDYMGAETPEWAGWGRGGFDPRDQRVNRKGRPMEI